MSWGGSIVGWFRRWLGLSLVWDVAAVGLSWVGFVVGRVCLCVFVVFEIFYLILSYMYRKTFYMEQL